jgi:hypothetical protein
MILALFLSNAYDKALFLSGTLDYNGLEDKDKLILFTFRLFYANARSKRFADAGCTSPECINNHYLQYVAIGFSDDMAITEANSAVFEAQLEQFQAVLEGADDVSNNAIFALDIHEFVADDNMYDALMALQE